MLTNAEADRSIRTCIEENGRAYGNQEVFGNGAEPNQEIVAYGVDETETIKAIVPEIGVVSGLVACRALIIVPGAEELFGTNAEGAMLLRVQLGWHEEQSEFVSGNEYFSRAVYRLERSDPIKIDEFYAKLRGYEEKRAAQVDETTEEPVMEPIKTLYEQGEPQPLLLPGEEWEDDVVGKRVSARNAIRVNTIRAFKDQHPHLTLLSTSDGGNIHDDEIPLLTEWLVN